ncbi:helix-turn-helix transcriptional regulator [Bremerella alba]|uniref:HTH-type transcriptional activator RhaR n=1 Tax=Bremerella alba TaxID=980252 RepID=A0A7V8V2L2_9BACT|nr:helix-turn-helix domain-containing protein [Bremerella alba]MBA2113779.1 HTH-type transcriptional activator RhaR [Bremerella alba]
MTSAMHSVSNLRAKIEGFASRYAAMRVADGGSYQTLLDQFQRMEETTRAESYDDFAQCDQDFHRAIVELADVPSLHAAWREVFLAHSEFRIGTLEQCWPDLTVLFESHRPLVEAIASGQAHEAEEAAVAHLDAVWFRLALLSDAPEFGQEALPSDPLARACAYLAFHFTEAVRLPYVAKEISKCTAGHLARLFREQLGLSFSEYLIELRLQKSVQLLQITNRSIQEIAERVGYSDPSRFSMHFRRRFGKTPTSFRETYSFGTIRVVL